jgi:two-component system cell cycle response regulator DivK
VTHHRDGARVLVVDDNDAFIEMTKFVLTAAGNLVDAASEASAALSMSPIFHPDVILMDIQMPVIDGIELTKRLKSEPATRKIPIIAFTTHAPKGEEHHLKAIGFDGYIEKPIHKPGQGVVADTGIEALRRSDALASERSILLAKPSQRSVQVLRREVGPQRVQHEDVGIDRLHR